MYAEDKAKSASRDSIYSTNKEMHSRILSMKISEELAHLHSKGTN